MARQAGDLRVAFKVDPAWVGVSRFQVELSDAQGLPPDDVRQVVLTFTMEGMNMGRTTVTMTPRGDGRYEAEGFYIGMPGLSQVGVAVERAGGGGRTAVFRVEVPDVNPQQLASLWSVLGLGGGGFPGVAGAPARRRCREPRARRATVRASLRDLSRRDRHRQRPCGSVAAAASGRSHAACALAFRRATELVHRERRARNLDGGLRRPIGSRRALGRRQPSPHAGARADGQRGASGAGRSESTHPGVAAR